MFHRHLFLGVHLLYIHSADLCECEKERRLQVAERVTTWRRRVVDKPDLPRMGREWEFKGQEL